MTRIFQELEKSSEWVPVVYLAADIEGLYNGRTTRSAEEAVRRACKRLAAKGLVELGYMSMSTGKVRSHFGPGADGWGLQAALLVVRQKLASPQ